MEYKIKLFRYLLIVIVSTNLLNAKKITLQLSWFDQFQFAGYYMAKEKGFYDEVGLDVNIKPFEFGLDIPAGVSKGKYDFAVGRETLILEKAKDKSIVALYALFQASPLVLISTKDSGIDTITKFANKRIMTTIDDAGEVSLKAMIKSQKLDIKKLHFIKHTHNINDLVKGNTDVISAYTSKSPYQLRQMGIEFNLFAPKEYGFDMYSDLLYTSQNKISNDLDTVMKFKNASLQGWEYAYNNIEETVDLILKKYNTQNLTKQELLFEAKELKKLSFYNTNELGHIELAKLQRIYDLYNVMGLVENKIDIKDFVLVDDGLIAYIKKVWNNLSRYAELPYIYFFISLFFILIILLVYKHFILYQTSKKLATSNEELYNLYMTDQLTQVYNRYKLDEILSNEVLRSQRYKNTFGIIILDIDNFKLINDTYGHLVGDKVLIQTAKILQNLVRTTDTVGRWGGEEFLIICPEANLETLQVAAEKIRAEIQNKKFDTINTMTISLGLTIFKDGDTGDKLLARADTALYSAKKSGKNKAEVII